MQLIGLTGAKGSGKSTVAAILEEDGWVRLRMGDPMKAMISALGVSQDEIDGAGNELPCSALAGATPRFAQQMLGDGWGRRLMGRHFWTELMALRLVALRDERPLVKVVVEDIRYPDVAEMIGSFNGDIWRVRRPDVEPQVSGLTRLLSRAGLSKRLHVSELHWRSIPTDAEIPNTLGLDALRLLVMRKLHSRFTY